jgi:hypothetical protein
LEIGYGLFFASVYVSLKGCIADILAHGYEVDVITHMTDRDTSIVSIS